MLVEATGAGISEVPSCRALAKVPRIGLTRQTVVRGGSRMQVVKLEILSLQLSVSRIPKPESIWIFLPE